MQKNLFHVSDPVTQTSSTLAQQKQALRKKIRQQRNALSHSAQKHARQNLSRKITQSRLLLKHQHIALFLSNDGELGPDALINTLLSRKKTLFLPVIDPLKKKSLIFCRYTQNTTLQKNRYGILEPSLSKAQKMPGRFLSLVFLPLVAFDREGNRMGMGGGYYDRCFAFKHNHHHRKPALIGLAHYFQEQESLPTEKWDVPLNGIISDRNIYFFDRGF